MTNPARNKLLLVADTLIEQVLTQAQSSRQIVQDFVPLAQSLEWDLGQQYLRQRGNKAFISDSSPVPFVINNMAPCHAMRPKYSSRRSSKLKRRGRCRKNSM